MRGILVVLAAGSAPCGSGSNEERDEEEEPAPPPADTGEDTLPDIAPPLDDTGDVEDFEFSCTEPLGWNDEGKAWKGHPIQISDVLYGSGVLNPPIDAREFPYVDPAGLAEIRDSALLTLDIPEAVDPGFNQTAATVAPVTPSGKGAGDSASVTDVAVVAAIGAPDLGHPNPSLPGYQHVWLADSSGILMGRMPDYLVAEIVVGQRVQISVNQVGTYHNMPMYMQIEDLLLGTNDLFGYQHVNVTVIGNGNLINGIDPLQKMVRVWGQVEAQVACLGVSKEARGEHDHCYELRYLDGVTDDSYSVRLRMPPEHTVEVNDCVDYLGPVTRYEGWAHLHVEEPEWMRVNYFGK